MFFQSLPPEPFLLLLVALPFIGTAMIVAGGRRYARFARLMGLMILGVALVVLGALTSVWDAAEPIRATLDWAPAMGLRLDLWLDGPALFWAWLVLGVGFLVFHYSGHYMDPSDSPGRFYASMLAFIGAMLGLVVARTLLLTFVFWEMTSLTSFLLIGHWHRKKEAVAGAKRALLVTGLGGLSLLSGTAVIAYILHDSGLPVDLSWEGLWAAAEIITAHRAAPWALVLLLGGAFTKSAQFPFHFWLPGAMQAPTPVSALLHAATMVKAGIYLLGRIYPIFGDTELWLWLVPTVGIATMFIGGYIAILCPDLKQLLAYSTVSQLGLLTAFYGLGHGRIGVDHALPIDLLLVASHAFFKGGLFMLVGVVDHGAHTRDWRRLGGLWRVMPVSTVLMAIGAASMAGLPLLLGFIAKKSFFDAAYYLHTGAAWVDQVALGAVVVASFFTTAYCLQLVLLPFFGKARDAGIHAHEGGFGILFAPTLLMLLCVAGGLWVPLVSGPLGALTRPEFYATTIDYKVAMFKHLDLKFWLSVATWVGGVGVFYAAGRIGAFQQRIGSPSPFRGGFDRLFNDTIPAFATRLAALAQSPSLQRNSLILFSTLVALIALPVAIGDTELGRMKPLEARHLVGGALGLFMLIMLFLVIRPVGQIVRIMALGMIGFIIAGFFVVYRAPDLAITQVLVELAMLLMLLILMRRVGRPVPKPTGEGDRWVTLTVAAAVGITMGTLTLFSALSEWRDLPIEHADGSVSAADYYLTHSKYPPTVGEHSGGGLNVVNVILVDFRGLDTLGEITVLIIAALGVGALLRDSLEADRTQHPAPPIQRGEGFTLQKGFFGIRRRRRPKKPDHYTEIERRRNDLRRLEPSPRMAYVVRETAPLIATLIFGFAIVLFLSGHNAPGGGFIGGLLSAIALTPFLLAQYRRHERRLDLSYDLIVGMLPIGLGLACLGAAAPMLLGLPFFRSGFTYLTLPLFGELEFAWALVFDTGVFLSVLGVTLILVKKFWRT